MQQHIPHLAKRHKKKTERKDINIITYSSTIPPTFVQKDTLLPLNCDKNVTFSSKIIVIFVAINVKGIQQNRILYLIEKKFSKINIGY